MNLDRPSSRVHFLAVALVSGFCFCVLLYSAVLIRFPDNFFADDSYFYFQVASNVANHLGSTFNGIVPTNGYHPLWMLVCIVVFKVSASKVVAVRMIGVVIALLTAITLYLLAKVSMFAAEGLWWIPLLLYMPFMFLSQLGTEGALSGFLVTVLILQAMRLVQKPSYLRAFLFALAGSLAVLARLDNIFIVGMNFLAIVFFAPIQVRSGVRRAVFLILSVYATLWGAYIATNLLWFGTVQPISGLLKSRYAAHSHLTPPPHVALLALAIIIPTIAVLARFHRDTFFRIIELPLTLGVFTHAFYIFTVMGHGETRWTWYYTTWILLASILMARTSSVLLVKLGKRRSAASTTFMCNALGLIALSCLLVAWFPLSYRKFGHSTPEALGVGYQQNLVDRLHLHAVLTFDKPGRMAFYSDVRVIPLDGLMGDLKFQREIASRGIAAFDQEHDVRAFIGPPQPLGLNSKELMCDGIYLGSTKLHCVMIGPNSWIVDSVEVFSRLTGASAGSLNLARENLVWNKSDDVAVWLISPNSSDQPPFSPQ
jgi:hypothetical protein